MFVIKATQAITWPNLALRKGENGFASRKAIPAELWPKLKRFRDLKVIAFEGEAAPGGPELPKLEELTERQVYNLNKEQLLELAKANDIEGLDEGSKKKELVDALVAKLPKPEVVEKTVELTEDALGKLELDELRAVAAELKLDVVGLRSKRHFVDRILSTRSQQTTPAPVGPVSVS